MAWGKELKLKDLDVYKRQGGKMEQIDFKKTIDNLRKTGFNPVPNLVNIAIPDAKNILWQGLNYFTGNAEWLPEYDEIATWLSGNNGRGLLCHGNCGRGKSLICWKIIPLLLNHYCRKIVACYDAQQMNADIDAVKAKQDVYKRQLVGVVFIILA